MLEALLLVLFLVFLPLLARVTKRIQRQIERIHFQAYYDGLTRLPNRAHLFERLARAVGRATESRRTLAVLLLDLDRFREINDTLGHEAGDTVLVATAPRVIEAVPEEALVARLGGDELVVVAEYEDEDEVLTLAERIRSVLEAPVVLDGIPIAVGGTVGIAFFPKDGEDAETLVKHAEVATYTAKEWRVGALAYSPAVDPHDPEQLGLLAALREAIEGGEIVLRYQPKIRLTTRSVVGFEALAYWRHPTRGLLPPGAFVPVAERTGAIRHLSRAVLADAVEQLAVWDGFGVRFTVAVNLSAIDLLDVDLPDYLKSLLARHGVQPEHLCLEVTESSVMADPERAVGVLEQIVATGARVAVDDFGTGHSSLAYLKDLPVHEVKIDRGFVTAMARSSHDRSIVEAAIRLGHSFGFEVVAEGVEGRDVETALRELGCDYAQGYLYGRPESAKVVTRAVWSRNAA